MTYRWYRNPVVFILTPLVLVLLLVAACGDSATSTPRAAGPTAAPAPTTAPAPAATATQAPVPTTVPQTTQYTEAAKLLMEGGPLGLAAGNGETPRQGGIFLANDWEPIPFFDMHQTSFGGVYVITAPAYNGLLATSPYDPTATEIIPDLARSWDIEEAGARIVFHLAEGVKWHDGVAFSSEDVKYTIERILNDPAIEGFVSPRQGVFKAVIDTVETDGPNTVVINGNGPSPLLLPLFSNGWNAIIPKHIVEPDPANALMNQVIGTGAFRLIEQPSTTLWRYERNPDYFEDGLPYLDGIEYHIIQDGQAQAAALLTQRIYFNDAFGGLAWDPDLAKSVVSKEPHLVHKPRPSLAVLHMVMNATRPPTDDIRVRQAINEALDREIFPLLSPWSGVVGTGTLPAGPWAMPVEMREQLVGYGPDMDVRIAHAKELLAEYEAENGAIDWGNITLQCSSNISWSCPNAVIIKDLLKEIDVDVETEPMDVTAHRGNEVSGDYILSTLAAGFDFDDPIDTFGQIWITDGGRWYQRHSVPEIDDLFNQQKLLSDFDERKKVVWEMDRVAMTESAYLVLEWPTFNHVQWDFVKGNESTPSARTTNARMKYVWLTCDAPTAGC